MDRRTTPIVAIITMTRACDFPYARSFFHPLELQLGPARHHFVLLNDQRNPALEEELAQRSHTTLLTPGHNLGVARGRNRLIEAAMNWGADLIVSLDDDLLVPADFIDRMVGHYDALTAAGHQVGIIGPAVLDYHESGIHDEDMQQGVESGQYRGLIETADLRRLLVERWSDDLPLDVVYHMGIRDWAEHYLRAHGPAATRVRSMARSIAGVSNEANRPIGEIRRTDHRHSVLATDPKPVPVDTLAGGVCAYPSRMITDIGLLEEAFSPFGYEDAEFAVRARVKGFENFVVPSEVLLHDLASRNKERSPQIVLVGLGKVRALIIRKQFDALSAPARIAETLGTGLLQVGFAISSRLSGQAASGSSLAAGLLTYCAGIIAGAFRPLSTAAGTVSPWEGKTGVWGPGSVRTATGRVRYERLVIRMNEPGDSIGFGPPVKFDGDIEGLAVRLAGAAPISGLPHTLKGSTGLTYHMDCDARRLEVVRLVLDLPGMITVKAAATLGGVGPGEPEPEVTAEGVSIESLDLEIRDRGFISRVESTVAWAQGLTSESLLGAVAAGGSSPAARAIRSWLTSRGSGTLALSARPDSPVTVGHLHADGYEGGDVSRLLGITARFHAEAPRSVQSW